MIDPFASINKTLTSIGAQPIKIGTSVAQTAGKPSTKQLVDDLTAEQRQEVEGSIGRNLLSGLGWVGEKLDALTGARALRGALGGDFREVLSAIPILGTFGDELGITSEEDYMDNTGRRLLEKSGMLGENKEGFDWGDVAGFAADVLLDPANLATLGGKGAGTAALKTLRKTKRGKRILKAAGKTENLAEAGIDAVNAVKGAGINEVGQKYTLKKLLELDEADTPNFVNELVADPNTGNLMRPLGAKSLREELIDTGADLTKELEEMPLRTPIATGLPFMKEGKLFGDYLDPVKTPKRYQAMEKLGYGMDRLGEAARTSAVGRVGAKLFDPRVRHDSTHEAAQDAQRHMYQVAEEVQGWAVSELQPLQTALDDSGLFDWQRIVDAGKNVGRQITKTEAQDIVQKRLDSVQDYLAGYERSGQDAARVIPEWDLNYSDTVSDAYSKGQQKIDEALSKLQDDIDRIDDKIATKIANNPNANVSALEARKLSLEAERQAIAPIRIKYQEAIDELSEIRQPGYTGNAAAALQRRVTDTHDLWSEARRVADEGDPFVAPYVARVRGGVYGRVAPKIDDELNPIQDTLDSLKQHIDDARQYARARGVEISDLDDDWTMYFPRQSFMYPTEAKNSYWKIRNRPTQIKNYDVRVFDSDNKFKHQRSNILRNLYGGTGMVDDLARAKGLNGEPFAGRLIGIEGDAEKLVKIKQAAEELATWIDANVYRKSKDLQGREFFDTLKKRDANGVLLDELDPKKLEQLAGHLGHIDPRHGSESMRYFEANPVKAVAGYYTDVIKSAHAAEAATKLMAEHASMAADMGTGAVARHTIANMLKFQKINTWKAKKQVIDNFPPALMDGLKIKHAKDFDASFWDAIDAPVASLANNPEQLKLFEKSADILLDKVVIDKRLGDDIERYVRTFTVPDDMQEILAAFDKVTDLFKTSLTTPWPAFHARNLLSAVMGNFYAGLHDPTGMGPFKLSKPYSQMHAIMRGEVPENIASEIPMFNRQGLTDEEAVEKIKDLLMGHDVIGRRHTREELSTLADEGELGDFIGRESLSRPGRGAARGQKQGGFFKKAIDAAMSPMPPRIVSKHDAKFAHLAPGTGPGKMARAFDTLGTSKLSPFSYARRAARGGRAGAEHIETSVRGAGFLGALKQGFSPTEAARKVKLAQVDYNALSEFERNIMRRIIPFYSFTRRQIPFLIENLFMEPTGPMGQFVRGYGRIQRDSTRDTLVPEYISQTVGLPLPDFLQSGVEGQKRYLTGLGGILAGAEDVLGILRPGRTALDAAGRTGRGFASRMHPGIQIPLELMAGRSMFTGRPLEELSPTPSARLLGQLMGSDEPAGQSVLTPSAEVFLQRVPGFGRTVSTLRQLTDFPRSPVFGEEGFSAANLLRRTLPSTTGVRISDVDLDRQQNRLLQEIIEEHLRSHPDSRMFEHLYFSQEDLAKLSPEERSMYLLYKQLGKEATQRARTEREQRATAYST